MFVATFVLLATGLALAGSGVATLAGGDEDDGVRARGAQQPLGSLSATPPAPIAPDDGSGGSGTKGDQDEGGPGGGSNGDTGDGGSDGGGVEGDRVEGGPSSGIGPGGGSGGEVANASAGSDSLPFTGFLAIPVLLTGLSLLIGGAIVRSRAEQQPPA